MIEDNRSNNKQNKVFKTNHPPRSIFCRAVLPIKIPDFTCTQFRQFFLGLSCQ